MSRKLDQSLDEIMKDSKSTNGGRRGRPSRPTVRKTATKVKASAPAGGIQKKKGGATTATGLAKKVAALAAPVLGESSKISISNLPADVDEAQLKRYFTEIVGNVKRIIMNYGPEGKSRGSATVIFTKSDSAAKAAKLDGTEVDGKAFRIEILVGAKNVAKPKSLSERVTGKPKSAIQDKPKTTAKAANKTNGATNGAAKTNGARTGKKSGRGGKVKPKTTEELDAEMADYFNGDGANSAAQPAANGGDTMDEVL